jgi:D-3-phosphoglycerate dehydrogenase
MRIVVADPISQQGIELLRGAGWEILAPAHEDLQSALATADALIVRSATRVTSDLLEAGPRLRVVGRAGVGVDNIDVDAATARGVLVMNTPGGNSVSVAELALGLMIAVARHIPQLNATVHAGRWEKSGGAGIELRGKILGLIGLGRVGSEVVRRARAFGMSVIAHDPCLTEEAARNTGIELLPLADVFGRSDFLSLHTALNPATEKLIRAGTLAQFKRGAILINTARGELVDESALAEALRSGQLAGAGLDVFAEEPPLKSPLIGLLNVVATPHIAGSTREAQEEVGTRIAQQVFSFLTEGALDNAVNLPAVSGESYRRARPWIEMVTRLGAFVAQIAGGRFERVSLTLAGEAADIGASVLRNAALAGLLNTVLDEKVNLVNASKVATKRGLTVEDRARYHEQGYPDTVEITARAGRESRGATAEATVLHGVSPRILRVDGIELEAPLAGTMLFLRNRDVPGVIGRIGTILGSHGVNIATFALGRDSAGTSKEAIALVRLDGGVPEEAMQLIRGIDAITEVRLVQLPE